MAQSVAKSRSPRPYAAAAGILLAVGGCTHWASGHVYSEGYRDGFVQKFSHRGLFWKTWEAELGQFGFKSYTTGDASDRVTTTSNAWEFTVEDGSPLVDELKALKPSSFVRVHYREHLIRVPWKGSTSYFATRMEAVSDEGRPKDQPRAPNNP